MSGPWRVEDEGSLIVEQSPDDELGGCIVAAMYPRNRAANTCLIVAAPDMLAELKRLRDVVGEEDVSCIEAVIAQAEGKP